MRWPAGIVEVNLSPSACWGTGSRKPLQMERTPTHDVTVS